MPSPGGANAPRLPIEDSYLELLADTLETLEPAARGQFLQRYFRAIAHLELRESQCLQFWEETLRIRRELAERAGRPVSLKTALIDVLSSSSLLRVPVLIEYDELKRLQLNAITDPLTGLYNRRMFSESLEKEMTRARRYGHPVALVLLDLHRFKEVNDKHGHPKGDEVLRVAAKTLRKSMRSSDSAFRIGGDEFALLLPQTDAPQAIALSRRVESVFEEEIRALQLSVGVSMDHGLATYPQDGEQCEILIRIADERLYRLKHANHVRADDGGTATETKETPSSPSITFADRLVAEKPVTSQKTIPFGSKKTGETQTNQPVVPASSTPVPSSTSLPSRIAPSVTGLQASQATTYSVQRRGERVTMAGTNAYAIVGEPGGCRARVLDLGFGGVALELDSPRELPETVVAVLHVPILPPVRVSLRPVWSAQSPEGQLRVGCCFVS